MAGLVSSAMQPPAAQAAPAVPPQDGTTPDASGTAAPAVPQGVENPGSNLQNQTLNQIETGVEQKIGPEYQQMYKSIILAAMDLAFSEKTHAQLLKGMQSSPDVPKNVSLIVAGMIGIIFDQAQQDPNTFVPAAMPASIVIMCQVLEFAEQSGMTKLTPELIAQCTNLTSQAVLKKFGIDGKKLGAAIEAKNGAQAPADQGQAAPAPVAAAQPPMGA
jgi:hypothetical protein